jgi:plasmid stabilization system protein ParE
MYTLRISPRAVLMIQEAYDWYDGKGKGLGEKFLNALDLVFEKLENNPEVYGKVEREYRKVKIPVFPYVVVFEIIEENVVVFATFHTSRNPADKI